MNLVNVDTFGMGSKSSLTNFLVFMNAYAVDSRRKGRIRWPLPGRFPLGDLDQRVTVIDAIEKHLSSDHPSCFFLFHEAKQRTCSA